MPSRDQGAAWSICHAPHAHTHTHLEVVVAKAKQAQRGSAAREVLKLQLQHSHGISILSLHDEAIDDRCGVARAAAAAAAGMCE